MKTVWERDAGGGGGIGEDGEDDTQRIPEEANLSRGNSTRQLVDLGQSNGSSGDILVNGPECLQRQDEHPCMKTVWEMDAGGGGGVGGYETDEEEFLGVGCDSTEYREHHQSLFQPRFKPGGL